MIQCPPCLCSMSPVSSSVFLILFCCLSVFLSVSVYLCLCVCMSVAFQPLSFRQTDASLSHRSALYLLTYTNLCTAPVVAQSMCAPYTLPSPPQSWLFSSMYSPLWDLLEASQVTDDLTVCLVVLMQSVRRFYSHLSVSTCWYSHYSDWLCLAGGMPQGSYSSHVRGQAQSTMN